MLPEYKIIPNDSVKTTIAPYFDTELTRDNYADIKGKIEDSYLDTAYRVAQMLCIDIESVSRNIGGYTFEDGNKAGQMVRELSYTFELSGLPRKDALILASLMGDLAFEQQEAVIAASYEEIEDSNAIEYRIYFENIDIVLDALKKVGIDNYTIDTNNKVLKILEFNIEEPIETAKKIADLYELLGDEIINAEYTGVQTDYITKEDRRRIYKTWLDSNKGNEEKRNLYYCITKAYESVKLEDEEELSPKELYIKDLLAYIKEKGISLNEYFLEVGEKLINRDYAGIPEIERINPFLTQENWTKFFYYGDPRIVEVFASSMTKVVELNIMEMTDSQNIDNHNDYVEYSENHR